MNSPVDIPLIGFMGIVGFAAGYVFSPNAGWAVLALVIGVGLGTLMAKSGVRPVVGAIIAVGAVVGAWIGREIVRALCLPGSCPTVEVGAALFTGIGSMFGIGLVVALVVRSFDEYRERHGPQES